MVPHLTVAVLVLSMTCVGIPAARAAKLYALPDLPGGVDQSRAYAISGDGSVVVGDGSSSFHPPPDAHVWISEAAAWSTDGGRRGLGFLPPGIFSLSSRAFGVSRNGAVIVGESGRAAFRWTEETGMVGLASLDPWGGSLARAVSGDGSVIVGYTSSVPVSGGFRWTADDGMVGLGAGTDARDISDDGTIIVGWRDNAAAIWFADGSSARLGDLPAVGMTSIANAISADGSVVVGQRSLPSPDLREAVRWTVSGEVEGLGGTVTAEPILSYAADVSGDGSIVVGTSGNQAMIWDRARGMRLLKDALEIEHGLDLAGWSFQHALGISHDGNSIVGYGRRPDGQETAWIAVLRSTRCDDGMDDDGDGLSDFPADHGCASAIDDSERAPAGSPLVCDDGLDNDGDGTVDHPDDPGCPVSYATPENPACDDGIDNDGDGLIDRADETCSTQWPYWESAPCGLGVEVIAVLPILVAMVRRRSRAQRLN